MLIPIGTESPILRKPLVNYWLIGLNVAAFIVLRSQAFGPTMGDVEDFFVFDAVAPRLHQFFSYQFLHADWTHLLGNMLFLWVFGNAVNGKMGHLPYLLFYLGAGIFAAWAYAFVTPQPFTLVGASGAIAGVTTAYLALFPLDHVSLLFVFFLIRIFHVQAMIIIVVKIIIWDNIIGPGLSGGGNVAYGAHLAGYVYGFGAGIGMLLLHAVPRDRFDALALLKRWQRRREFRSVMAKPSTAAWGKTGTVGKARPVSLEQAAVEDHRIDRLSELRTTIQTALAANDAKAAVDAHGELISVDAKQCLSERDQLAIGRLLFGMERFPQAAAAFERFVSTYPKSAQTGEVQFLLGIIYAEHLHQWEKAEHHLTEALDRIFDPARKRQCEEWIDQVRSQTHPENRPPQLS